MVQLSWLIVTGAGASRELSSSGEPLPLMGDWSNSLIDHLERVANGSARELKLRRGLEGDVFEERLGDFLRWSLSLAPAKRFIGLGAETIGQPDAQVDDWFTQADRRSRDIVSAVRQTVYQLFGQGRIDVAKSRLAYGALFNAIGITPDAPIVYATTNYDNAGEIALDQLGRPVDSGEVASPISESHLDPKGLVEDMTPRRTPLLHLHGKVGWYRERGGRVVCHPSTSPYDESVGVPALLLPTPDKRYEEEPAVEAIWQEFDHAIAAQPRVFVIGHSLHDVQLVDRLRRLPAQQVAVTIQFESDVEKMIRESSRVRELLPDAHVIPMNFGPEPVVDLASLQNFLNNSAVPAFPQSRGSATPLPQPD